MASGSVGEEKVTGAKSPRPGRGEIPSDSSVQASTRASGGASSAKENGPDAAASGRRTRSVRRSDPEGHEEHDKGNTSPVAGVSDGNGSETHTRPPSLAPSSGDGERGCDNLHCIGGGSRNLVVQDEDQWGWCRDKIVKTNGSYKPWFPQFCDKLVSLTKDTISIDLDILHETQPPIFKIGTRVSVVYDDGYAYPGAIIAEGARTNSYRIRLDEGTAFTTMLPDNDVDILDGPYRTKGRASALRAHGGKRQRVAPARLGR